MEWENVLETVDRWTAESVEPARRIKVAASSLPAVSVVGYYWNPEARLCGIHAGDPGDRSRALKVALAVYPHVENLTDVRLEAEPWVKVAYSPTLHRAGELLNFFPGQYPGDAPNSPSPLAAMLTSGLLGAGLGWAGGRLAKKVLPEGYGDNLGRTGMLLGGLAGLAPGLMWGGANKLDGRAFNDPSLLQDQGDGDYPSAIDGANAMPSAAPASMPNAHLTEAYLATPQRLFKRSADLAAGLVLPVIQDAHTRLVKAAWPYNPEIRDTLPTDVNIDHLGRTLWDAGASPSLTATAMGAVYAARQFPDRNGREDIVTGNQLGQLTANAIGDYARGYAVGAAINGLIGTPYSAPAFGTVGAGLGILGGLIPKLFGN